MRRDVVATTHVIASYYDAPLVPALFPRVIIKQRTYSRRYCNAKRSPLATVLAAVALAMHRRYFVYVLPFTNAQITARARLPSNDTDSEVHRRQILEPNFRKLFEMTAIDTIQITLQSILRSTQAVRAHPASRAARAIIFCRTSARPASTVKSAMHHRYSTAALMIVSSTSYNNILALNKSCR